MTQGRVLVADDQSDVLNALKLLLGGEGYDVTTASSPKDLVATLEVRCTVTMDAVEGKGHRIVSSELDVAGRAEGIDEAGFEGAAQAADKGCSFSALIGASASVSVRAHLKAS